MHENISKFVFFLGLSTHAAVLDFRPGEIRASDFNLPWNTSVMSMQGNWRVVNGESDSMDPMMEALQINLIRRWAVRDYPILTSLEFGHVGCCTLRDVKLTSFLPHGVTKGATMPLSGRNFTIVDDDTGGWTCVALYRNGQLLQRRVSATHGTMFDIRVVFDKDPRRRIPGRVMLFRWTLITPDNVRRRADRWQSFESSSP